jgi:glycerol-3-phosphate dehydrogenase (NAD(P)+)
MGVVQSVLGCGRWGSFHLWYGSRVGNRVTGWEPGDAPGFRQLVRDRRNGFLALPRDVELTTDLGACLGADIITVTVPAQRWRSLARELSGADLSGSDLVLCMKGMEKETGLRLSEVALEEGLSPRSLTAWLGPGHPQEFLSGVPSCMLMASDSDEAALRLSGIMSSPLIRFYRSRDLIGCEVGAAAKNVMGIAAGILDGLGMSGLKGALMARAPQEVARLVARLGGDWRSVYGLSHLGDYEATLFSPLSRNRLFGEYAAGGRGDWSGELAEGVDTSRALLILSGKLELDMPITAMVRAIIDGGISAEEAISSLFSRPQKEEFPDDFSWT